MRLDAQGVPQLLGDGHLTLDGDGGGKCHGNTSEAFLTSKDFLRKNESILVGTFLPALNAVNVLQGYAPSLKPSP